jgi:predicted nuclease of predicted toxin-antitoxin system
MTPAPPGLRVYLDEDVDVLLAGLLTARGYDCLTTMTAGRLGKTDEEQLEFAGQESRVLITHNRTDFENLARAWWSAQRDHAGIVLALRRADVYDLARHVIPVLQLYDQAGWRNTILYA